MIPGIDGPALRRAVNRQMYLTKRRVQVIAVIAAVAAGLLILARAGGTDRRDAADFERAETVLTEDDAIRLAFQEARETGLPEPPSVWLARRITFGEFSTLAGDRATAFAGTPDIDPGAVTWVVSMRGEWSTQLLGQEAIEFDNLTVVLDAVTGAPLHTATYFEEFESGVRLPRFFDPSSPCDEDDLGDFDEIFKSTCPYPAAEAPGEVATTSAAAGG